MTRERYAAALRLINPATDNGRDYAVRDGGQEPEALPMWHSHRRTCVRAVLIPVSALSQLQNEGLAAVLYEARQSFLKTRKPSKDSRRIELVVTKVAARTIAAVRAEVRLRSHPRPYPHALLQGWMQRRRCSRTSATATGADRDGAPCADATGKSGNNRLKSNDCGGYRSTGFGVRVAAFTLIELLVVIAILGLLAAMVFPVFAQARAKARQTQDISNLRQIGVAVLLYAQDYDESVVPYRVRSSSSVSSGPLNNRYWFGRTAPASAAPYNAPPYSEAPCPSSASCNVFFDPSDGLISPYTRSETIQNDPAAAGIAPAFATWRNGNRVPAYAVYPVLFPDLNLTNAPAATTLAGLDEPASTLLLVDAAFFDPISQQLVKAVFIQPPWSGTRDNGGVDSSLSTSSRVHGRHPGGRASILWADGHVSSILPTYRPVGRSGAQDSRRARSLGELSPVALPATIGGSDPNLPRYNYYFALNKQSGR